MHDVCEVDLGRYLKRAALPGEGELFAAPEEVVGCEGEGGECGS